MTLTTRLAIAMIVLVAAAVSAVGWLSYHAIEQALLPRILEGIEANGRLVADDLQSDVGDARADLETLTANPAVRGMVSAHFNGDSDPVNHLSENAWRDRLAPSLIAELRAKSNYARIRIVGMDDDGREVIRIDRSGPDATIRVAPDAELQRKGDRSYFKTAARLAPGGIDVSPIELDHEGGAGEASDVPVIRIAAPLHDGRDFYGVVVVDVDMRDALERTRSAGRPGETIYLVDAEGNYLVHPDRRREFEGRRGGWQSDFPYFAALTGSTTPAAKAVPDASGGLSGAALAPALLVGKQWVAVIEVIPNAVFMAAANAIGRTTVLVGLVAMMLAAALAFILARTLTHRINRLRWAVESIGRDERVKIPVDAGGETGVLARAFERVMGEVKSKAAELEREVLEHRRTEAARDHHAARERLFSAAVESSNDAIVTESPDGIITGWNPAAERMFGYLGSEAVGRSISLIVPEDRAEEIDAILRRIGRGERIEHHETMRRRKDGSLLQVSISISPIASPAGDIVGASEIARDVSEIRRTERALHQQLEERERIFETSQDLILVLDSQDHLVQISPSCQAILGHRPDDMIGRCMEEFIHPDDVEITRTELRNLRRGLRGRIPDSRLLHRDGREVVLSWLGTWSEPVQRYFFVGRDMTETRIAQETLRESERLARNIVETALDAFVQTDDKDAILNWNSEAERIFGWPREQVLGKKLIDLVVREADRQELRQRRLELLDLPQDVVRRRSELWVCRRGGGEFKAELSITALKTSGGMVLNAFFRDLTDKIAAEERIRQAEKMEAVGQLTGGIAHDFNNILTVITGTIEILAQAVTDEPQLAAITKMIDDAAARGADLTQHLLAFARKQPLQPREIDINALVADTAKLLRPTLGKNIEITSMFEDLPCIAVVDPNQLATAILNLAFNARDAMPNGGKLILETASVYLDEAYAELNDVQAGHYLMIAVTDTGTGIPAEIVDRVFDPFFTSKGPGRGTGLGLSMVYGFVKQSCGHINICTEEGRGTTVRMYLPPGTGASLAPEKQVIADAHKGHETVLVVEDDRLVKQYVLAQLHSLGYSTLQADNAAEALAIVEQGCTFDLLFTDIIMSGEMNGRQLADKLLQAIPDLKVLFTSGYAENAIIHHGRIDDGVLLLQKPYRKSDLARMIRRALDG